jgi:hypothetical protein
LKIYPSKVLNGFKKRLKCIPPSIVKLILMNLLKYMVIYKNTTLKGLFKNIIPIILISRSF